VGIAAATLEVTPAAIPEVTPAAIPEVIPPAFLAAALAVGIPLAGVEAAAADDTKASSKRLRLIGKGGASPPFLFFTKKGAAIANSRGAECSGCDRVSAVI